MRLKELTEELIEKLKECQEISNQINELSKKESHSVKFFAQTELHSRYFSESGVLKAAQNLKKELDR